MARSTITVNAPPSTVFGVLSDPPDYSLWVVGSKAIRRYDEAWPAPGSEFHHTVGVGFLVSKDKTVVLETDPGRRLVLRVRALPFMRATVTFTLEAEGFGTRVTMEEHPNGAPWERLWNPVLDTLTVLRNAATLRRLKRLTEVRGRAVYRRAC